MLRNVFRCFTTISINKLKVRYIEQYIGTNQKKMRTLLVTYIIINFCTLKRTPENKMCTWFDT